MSFGFLVLSCGAASRGFVIYSRLVGISAMLQDWLFVRDTCPLPSQGQALRAQVYDLERLKMGWWLADGAGGLRGAWSITQERRSEVKKTEPNRR